MGECDRLYTTKLTPKQEKLMARETAKATATAFRDAAIMAADEWSKGTDINWLTACRILERKFLIRAKYALKAEEQRDGH